MISSVQDLKLSPVLTWDSVGAAWVDWFLHYFTPWRARWWSWCAVILFHWSPLVHLLHLFHSHHRRHRSFWGGPSHPGAPRRTHVHADTRPVANMANRHALACTTHSLAAGGPIVQCPAKVRAGSAGRSSEGFFFFFGNVGITFGTGQTEFDSSLQFWRTFLLKSQPSVSFLAVLISVILDVTSFVKHKSSRHSGS